jgi:hypothetical protein
MDLDTSALWSWTIPLWGLFVLVLFLGGVMVGPTVLESIGPSVAPAISVVAAAVPQSGGARSKRVTWSNRVNVREYFP